MKEDTLKAQLELGARVGAVALVGLYVAGFLVVAFQNAQYGIVEFGLFRARVLSAGISFMIFLMLPMLEFSKTHGLFGFNIRLPEIDAVGETSKRYAYFTRMFRTSHFFSSAWGISNFFWLWFADFSHWKQFLGVTLGYIVVSSGLFASAETKTRFSRYPTLFACLSVLVNAAGIGTMFAIHQWLFAVLVLWFGWVGVYADSISALFRNPSRLRTVNWPLAVFNTVGTLAIFAIAFYPHLKPSLGGGKPTKVTLQFVASSPIDRAPRNDVWLLDEVESGYYVIPNERDNKAVFLPKSLVSAVFFSE